MSIDNPLPLSQIVLPSSVSGLIGWYRGDDPINGAIADGSPLTQWLDRSGHGNNLNQLGASMHYRKNVINAHSVVDWTGSNGADAGNMLLGLSSATIFACVKADAASSVNNFPMWDLHDRSGVKCVTEPSAYADAGGNVKDGSFYSVQHTVAPDWAVNAYNVVAVRVQPGAGGIYEYFVHTVVKITDNTGNFVNNSGPRFGANCNGDKFWNGRSAEMCIWNQNLSDGDMTSMWNYFFAKFAL